MSDSASLYFHIPFCTKKCPYCHFYVIPKKDSYQEILLEGFLLEWEKKAPLLEGFSLASLYLGGGTPSLFTKIENLLSHLPRPKEITIEANPEELTKPLLEKFLYLGINRISIGVQSFDDRSLQTLERIHSSKKALWAVQAAKEVGFSNISIDLMIDLPGQTQSSFHYTLEKTHALPIQHISLYNLVIEPHTLFHKRGVKPLRGKRLLDMALKSFEKMGFKRYEISAFAKEGFESIHNLGYWSARPFLGFGPSAFSYWEKKRFQNIPDLHKWKKRLEEGAYPTEFEERLSPTKAALELLVIGLRRMSGVFLSDFSLGQETLKRIEKLKSQGLLEERQNVLRLTQKGTFFYDSVAIELI